MNFEWDSKKADSNFRKHRVSFVEASTVFHDPLSITIFDPQHSEQEDRYITIGVSLASRVLMVAHTDRKERIRIISARQLTHKERKDYEDELQKRNG
jgi:uncharacterized protein